jgi:hypothetical protein
VTFANDKGKENIDYFLALSGETAEFAIPFVVNLFILRMNIKLHCRHASEVALVL